VTHRWLVGFLRPHRAAIGGVVILSFFATALALAQPYITKLLIDRGLIASQPSVVSRLAILLVIFAAVSSVTHWVNLRAYTALSAKLLFELREKTFSHILRLSPDFHARIGAGELLSRLDGDIAEVQRFSLDTLLGATSAMIGLTGTLAILFWMSGPLAIIALMLLPLQMLYLRKVRPRVAEATRDLRERVSDITRLLVNTLTAAKFIQTVGGTEMESRRLEGLNGRFLRTLIQQQWVGYTATALPAFASTLATATVFVAGSYAMADGRLSVGTLVAFVVYLARAAGPANSLLGIYVASQRARISIDRVAALWDEPPAVCQPQDPVKLLARARGGIVFEHVTFRYRTDGPAILSDVSFGIPAGSKVAIVGRSGAGKSTLVDLVIRHFDPQVGRIILDGVDLRLLDINTLRRRIAVVPQEATLLPMSIADNIAYPHSDVPLDAVREAAEHARADEFIASLPDGYDSVPGVRGGTLSGGERQRMALARAVLQDPLVLILDEATSSLDKATEHMILSEIDRLFAKRTRIIVTHRREILADVDVVLEFSDGRLLPAVAAA
jgi:ATP-binding cassette subfamily B protein